MILFNELVHLFYHFVLVLSKDVPWKILYEFTCGIRSLKLLKLYTREDERIKSPGGSGLPHKDDAHDVDDRSDIESNRFRLGDVWTCFNIYVSQTHNTLIFISMFHSTEYERWTLVTMPLYIFVYIDFYNVC